MNISEELEMWLEDNIDLLEETQKDLNAWKKLHSVVLMQSSYLIEELIQLLNSIDVKIPEPYLELWKTHISIFRTY